MKGMYFARRPDGPNDLVAFWLACAGVLDQRPFLLFEFASGSYWLDPDGDGCADGAGSLAGGAVDPADFLPALPPSRRACTPDSVGEAP